MSRYVSHKKSILKINEKYICMYIYVGILLYLCIARSSRWSMGVILLRILKFYAGKNQT